MLRGSQMLKRRDVEQKMIDLNFNTRLLGFKYSVETVLIFDKKGTAIPMMKVYKEIAEKYNTDARSVERAMRFSYDDVIKRSTNCEEVERYIGYDSTGSAAMLSRMYYRLKDDLENRQKDKQKELESLVRKVVREELRIQLGGQNEASRIEDNVVGKLQVFSGQRN